MKIQVSNIYHNPHRDLKRNPISEDQIDKLVDSINRTGFWDNLVVRPHPTMEGGYQLAYGHNRMEACRRIGIDEVELPVRELADYDMLCCMIDENNTQQSVTPKVVFENVTAAIALAERFLSAAENVNDFNNLLKTSRRVDPHDVNLWRNNEYEKAKFAISEDGDGLGKDFIKHFMPDPPKDDHTTQAVIDSYYADRRKKAADKREAESREAARLAEIERQQLAAEAKEKRQAELQAQRERDEAARKQREAKAAADKAVRDQDEAARLAAIQQQETHRKAKEQADADAKKAAKANEELTKAANKKAKESTDHSAKADREKAKSERMDFAGVDRDLLETLDSTTKMNDVVRLIKKHKIPKEHHAELVKEAAGWSSDGPSTNSAGTSVSVKGYSWWDDKSGARSERFKEMDRRAKDEFMRNKFGSDPFETTVFKFAENLRIGNAGPLADLKRCAEHFDALNPERLDRLCKVLAEINRNHNEAMDELMGKINDLRVPAEKDVTPIVKMLDYQQGKP